MPDARPVALVTGASSGIGAEIARQLAAKGHDLALAARRTGLMEELADELRDAHGAQVDVFGIDLSAPGAAGALHERVAAAGLWVDYLVNDAGATLEGRFLDFTAEQQIGLVHLLAVTPTDLVHRCLPAMLDARRGTVLTISSLGAYWPCFPGITVYAGAKSLVVNLTRTLATEYRGQGVTFSADVPFATDTDFLASPANRRIVGRLPGFMLQRPDDVARIAIDGAAAGHVVQHTSRLNMGIAGLMKVVPPSLVGRAIVAFMTMGQTDLRETR